MTEDEKLMTEIRAHGERARVAAPKMIDALALATALGARYEHRAVADIREQIIAHWQSEGLFYQG